MNSQKAPQPLTTEELDALLFQPTGAKLTIAQSDELASLRSVLTDFRDASVIAAEHHYRRASITPTRSRTMSAFWAFAAAVLLVSIASPMAFRHHPAPTPAVATVSPQQQPIPAVSDEVLLADVQADLDASVPSPMLPLTNSTTTKSTTQRTR